MAFLKKLGALCVTLVFFCQVTAEECPKAKDLEEKIDKVTENYGCDAFVNCRDRISQCTNKKKVKKNLRECLLGAKFKEGSLSEDKFKEAQKEFEECEEKMEGEKESKSKKEEERKEQKKALKEEAKEKKDAVEEAEKALSQFAQDFPENLNDRVKEFQGIIETLKYGEILDDDILKIQENIEANETEHEKNHLVCISYIQERWQEHRRKPRSVSEALQSNTSDKESFLDENYQTCMAQHNRKYERNRQNLQNLLNTRHIQIQAKKAEATQALEDLLKHAPENYKKQMTSLDESLKKAYKAHVDAENKVLLHSIQKYSEEWQQEAKSKMWEGLCLKQKEKAEKDFSEALAQEHKRAKGNIDSLERQLVASLRNWPVLEEALKKCDKQREEHVKIIQNVSQSNLNVQIDASAILLSETCREQAQSCEDKKTVYCNLIKDSKKNDIEACKDVVPHSKRSQKAKATQ